MPFKWKAFPIYLIFIVCPTFSLCSEVELASASDLYIQSSVKFNQEFQNLISNEKINNAYLECVKGLNNRLLAYAEKYYMYSNKGDWSVKFSDCVIYKINDPYVINTHGTNILTKRIYLDLISKGFVVENDPYGAYLVKW